MNELFKPQATDESFYDSTHYDTIKIRHGRIPVMLKYQQIKSKVTKIRYELIP